jgi:integrase
MKCKSCRRPMSKPVRPLLHLPDADWPEADRAAFASAFDSSHDVFDDSGGGSRLKPRTKASLRFGYRRWLGWIHHHRPELMAEAPECRPTPETVKAFVIHLRDSCQPRTIASLVGKLHDAIRHMYPANDWNWLKQLKTRLERAAPKPGRPPILVTSQRLLDAGLERLVQVEQAFAAAGEGATPKHLQALALGYRDGLLVAIASLVPMRRTNIAQLEIGTTIRRGREHWSIHLPGDIVKNEEPIVADLDNALTDQIDRYIQVYRPLICRSNTHKGFWASAKGQPATGDALYNAFKKEVKAALDLGLTLHDVRRVGVTTWAVHDPVNAAGAKDLLGDRSDRVIAQHYNLANGVEASRRMADLLQKLKA